MHGMHDDVITELIDMVILQLAKVSQVMRLEELLERRFIQRINDCPVNLALQVTFLVINSSPDRIAGLFGQISKMDNLNLLSYLSHGTDS